MGKRTFSVCFCHRDINPHNKRGVYDEVEIIKGRNSNQYHYSNLKSCGSVWTCPVCAAKISERKRLDLVQGVDSWKASGGQPLLLTLTVPHYQNDSCKQVLDGITDAFRRFTNRKQFKRLASSIGIQGRIRSLETTYGVNGWHVHFHVLLFVCSPLSDDSLPALQESLYSMWHSAAVAAGLPAPSRSHGVKVDNGEQAAQYVGKWGLEHEMTKGHIKQSKGGYSPFDLLRIISGLLPEGEVRHLDNNPTVASNLFREYAEAFVGKRQLVWSDGLRSLLGLGQEKSDEEIADEPEDFGDMFALIPLPIWFVIWEQGLAGYVLVEVCPRGHDYFYSWMIDYAEHAGLVDD